MSLSTPHYVLSTSSSEQLNLNPPKPEEPSLPLVLFVYSEFIRRIYSYFIREEGGGGGGRVPILSRGFFLVSCLAYSLYFVFFIGFLRFFDWLSVDGFFLFYDFGGDFWWCC